MMDACVYPLKKINSHYFLEIEGGMWLVDTGAPITFGTTKALNICGEHFHFNNTYLSLTTESLSEFIGTPCSGLLGMDLLRVHDIIFDLHKGEATFTQEKVIPAGTGITLEDFMGIPILPVEISGEQFRMFFDTGAQLSYFQNKGITSSTPGAEIEDFFPDVGKFITRTYQVEMRIGEKIFNLISGILPGLLGASLQLANVQGIIGNQIFDFVKKINFSPRSKMIDLIQ